MQTVAVVFQAQASNSNAVALGPRTIFTGLNASAIGPFFNGAGMEVNAVRNDANVSETGSSAVCALSAASSEFAAALGRRASATGSASLSMGDFAV